ncbi:YidC/Oxa1 family membrane protein insertase [Agromyces endophyticus]|uniref:YidC/Oxa1 family membrane protein insertase n=1 Tax=Agromyces sp. H17E-10 TaxID=2932244 RepID=UPI001FD3B195|nr:membrane protein insertase YidC [Agromyces sp. H17E-10]UOQ88205.1 YidC/Oxa1 family membrane protein insertase [Agromyces sp. H17E-10]
MDLYSFPPIAALLDGAHALLIGLADLLDPLVGVASAAAAIVLVTLLVRAVLIPVGISQAKAEQGRARLAPKLAALQRRFAKQPERLQQEMLALYRDEGTSPFAGCLPMLAQAPVVGIIYALFILQSIAGHPNALLQHTLAGVPLGSSLAGMIAAGTLTPTTLVVFAVVVVAIALVGETTRRVFGRQAAAAAQAAPVVPTSSAASATGSPLANPAAMRVLGLLQYVTAVIAMFVPLAAALYLLVTVTWTLGQRVVLRRAYPLPLPA